MSEITNTSEQSSYWTNRYNEQLTGWDIGYPSTPLKTYIDQLKNKDLKILIPGAGNAYEAEYLFEQGFKNTHVLDISEKPLAAFAERNPHFLKTCPEPASGGKLIKGNFFEHEGRYDLIFEQTFFCSFPPTKENRERYAKQMAQLLPTGGKLVGLWFDIPLTGDLVKRPFGGSREEYLGYLEPFFEVKVLEGCYNSIEARQGKELFGVFVRK